VANMKNRDGSDSNVKFVSESTKKKTNKKGNPPEPKLAKRTPLATALANSARGFKGLGRLTAQDISRQFSIARGMVKKSDPSGRLSDQDVEYAAKKLKAKKKKVNPVAKGFAQDKRIRADKAKEKKAFSK
jgi:hypothetical protein